MASNITTIFDRMRTLVIDRLPSTFDVHHAALRDPWYLGPELMRDIEGAQQAGDSFLNAVVVSPGQPAHEIADASEQTQAWVQPLDFYFIYRRGPSLYDVAQHWADPLHEILCQHQLRRLDDLKFYDTLGRKTGHVVGFNVGGSPDLYAEPDNNALYPLGMACFSQRIEVESMVQLDPDARSMT